MQIDFDTSWGSNLGDGNRVDVDLCYACLKATLEPWLRIGTADWNQQIRRHDKDAAGQLLGPDSGQRGSLAKRMDLNRFADASG